MCSHDNPCEECGKAIAARRACGPDTDWHPSRQLQYLDWNNYFIPHPELKDEIQQLMPAVDDSTDPLAAGGASGTAAEPVAMSPAERDL